MKKLIVMMFAAVAMSVNAGPHHPHCPGPWRPVPHHYHPAPCHSFWPSFAGAAIGTVVANAIYKPQTVVVQQPVVTQPVVVQQPIVIQQPKTAVWVPGYYSDQVQPNGSIIRVWIEGHYEYR